MPMPPIASWCPADPRVPCTAPHTNGSDHRSSAAYDAVIEQFRVERNPRYQPKPRPLDDGTQIIDTGDGVLTWDVTRALGCEVPRWWEGRELKVNDLSTWFAGAGRAAGWELLPVEFAVQQAQRGFPTLAYRRTVSSLGKVAPVKPAKATDIGVQIAHAGLQCFAHGALERAFGRGGVVFFSHA